MIKGKRAFSFLFLLLFVAFTITSCKKESKIAAPPIPPNASIVIDFGNFSLKKDGWIEPTNWQYSVVTLAYWNSLIYIDCAIPLAAFQKASDQDAIYLDRNKWGWNYTINTDSLIINTKLEATIIQDSIQWKMFISTSKNNISGEPFLWLEGKSANNQTGGWWLFYQSPTQPNQFLKIDWKKGEKSTIKYTYVNKNDLGKGAFIIFDKTNDPVYDALYTVYNKQINNYFYIEWNTDNKEGRIKSSFLFNDTQWHCWDSNRTNSNCK